MALGEGIELELLEGTSENGDVVTTNTTTITIPAAENIDGGRRLSSSTPTGAVEPKPTPKAHRYFFNDSPVEKYYYH